MISPPGRVTTISMRSSSEAFNQYSGTDKLRTFRFQSDTPPRARPGSGRRFSKPDLGIFVPPLSLTNGSEAFAAVTLSTASNSPVRRKPVPGSATSLSQTRSRASSQSSAATGFYPPPRSSSLKSPTFSGKARSYTISSPGPPSEISLVVRDLDQNPHGATPPASGPLNQKFASADSRPIGTYAGASTSNANTFKGSSSSRNEGSSSLRHETINAKTAAPPKELAHTRQSSQSTAKMAGSPPDQTRAALQIDITRVEGSPPSVNNSNRPRSPGVALQNFFGWNRRDGEYGSISESPSVSPRNGSPQKGQLPLRHANTMPTSLDIPRANAFAFGSSAGSFLPTPPATNSQVNDLERELKELSAELANSIRREMELEDEVERLRSLSEQHQSESPRRLSDYFSDSGASSSRYGDADAKAEEMERMKRKTELEMAQMKLDMSEKMAEVLKKRRLAEDRIQLLEEHVQTMPKSPSPIMGNDKVKQLERLLDDAKRKIVEEQRSRDNMEELIGGMRHEIQQYRTERDNYRNEVVPQLVSKVSSLEMFISQGELISPLERPEGFADEDPIAPLSHTQAGLSRARSISNLRNAAARSRSNASQNRTRSRANSSVKEYAVETREQLLDRVKDMESQKDALHKALKSLLDRHNLQNMQYSNRILALEKERDKALFGSPRRMVFHREVKTLKEEILTLRQRADDALNQKWRCEKGLTNVRTDLDHAQRETSSLRKLLQKHDIQIPAVTSKSSEDEAALSKAYQELQTTHALSMVHLKDLETPKPFGPRVTSGVVLSLLKRSISDAEAERDVAQKSAEKYREQARQLQKSELQHLSKQKDLASDLFASAGRMDELAEQVRAQITSNTDLRHRLVEAVERGQREQSISTVRIAELQTRLRSLEDKLVTAQTASTKAISVHEQDVKLLEEGHRRQLHRSRAKSNARRGPVDSLIASNVSSPYLSPLSPALSAAAASSANAVFGTRSPRLTQTSSGAGMSMHQATGASLLEQKVQELEKALKDADLEMRFVVERMGEATMEVASLQAERDEATMRSRRLQAEIVAEREQVQRLMR